MIKKKSFIGEKVHMISPQQKAPGKPPLIYYRRVHHGVIVGELPNGVARVAFNNGNNCELIRLNVLHQKRLRTFRKIIK